MFSKIVLVAALALIGNAIAIPTSFSNAIEARDPATAASHMTSGVETSKRNEAGTALDYCYGGSPECIG